MATKTLLFESQRVGDAILVEQKLETMTTARFDVEIYGPDDRRADEAIKKDAALKKDLAAACRKAFDTYKADLGKWLTGEDKARKKLKGDALKKFDERFVPNPAHDPALKKMESTVAAETKKRWAKAVAGEPALKSVKFEPIVVPFLAYFGFVKEKTAQREEEEEPVTTRNDVGDQLTLAQYAIDGLPSTMRRATDGLQKAPSLVQSINATIAAVIKDYDAGPRESQRADEKTEPEDEPDESELDRAIYTEHGAAISKAYTDYGLVALACIDARRGAAEATAELQRALKKLSKAAKAAEAIGPEQAKGIAKYVDEVGAIIRDCVALQSEAKSLDTSLQASRWFLAAVNDKKAGSLGLLGKAKIDVTLPKAKLDAVLAAAGKIRVAPSLRVV